MSNQQHTPEPWYSLGHIISPDRNDLAAITTIAVCKSGRGGKLPISRAEAKANARRIVACVNACRGISVEWLEGWVSGQRPGGASFEDACAQAEAIETQRDELAAALRILGVLLKAPANRFGKLDFYASDELRAAREELRLLAVKHDVARADSILEQAASVCAALAKVWP